MRGFSECAGLRAGVRHAEMNDNTLALRLVSAAVLNSLDCRTASGESDQPQCRG